MNPERTLPWDWYRGTVPENVNIDESAYVETTFSFYLFRGRLPGAVTYQRGSSSYLGTMFDVGPSGKVDIGEYSLVHGARIICDAEVSIGAHALISWNVVLMDTYRLPFDPAARREHLRRIPLLTPRVAAAEVPSRPVRIANNVWIGFEACVLPGVSIGQGSIVGARSVVTESVPPYTIVAGNPARVIRKLEPGESRDPS